MNKENQNAGRDRENVGVNYQDSPHNEGQQNNITPPSGQPSSHNISRSVNEMKQEADNQQKEQNKQGQNRAASE